MKRAYRIFALPLVAALAACASPQPQYGEVVVMKAGEPSGGEYPSPGTVWRLDEAELKKLSPAPVQEPPPPPRRPPPRTYYPPPPWYYY